MLATNFSGGLRKVGLPPLQRVEWVRFYCDGRFFRAVAECWRLKTHDDEKTMEEFFNNARRESVLLLEHVSYYRHRLKALLEERRTAGYNLVVASRAPWLTLMPSSARDLLRSSRSKRASFLILRAALR